MFFSTFTSTIDPSRNVAERNHDHSENLADGLMIYLHNSTLAFQVLTGVTEKPTYTKSSVNRQDISLSFKLLNKSQTPSMQSTYYGNQTRNSTNVYLKKKKKKKKKKEKKERE